MPRSSLGLLQGTVDVLILRTLSWQSMHGYGIARWISDRSDGALSVEDAALYQALHRLERQGLVESEWRTTEKNHRGKYYTLTSAGRQRLTSEVDELREYMGVLFRVLDPRPDTK